MYGTLMQITKICLGLQNLLQETTAITKDLSENGKGLEKGRY